MTTHRDRQIARSIANRDQLIDFLNISKETYYQWLFDAGLQYLDRVLMDINDHIKVLSRSARFWKWWKNQYFIMDEDLLNEFLSFGEVDPLELIRIQKYYIDKHINTKVVLEGFLYQEIVSSRNMDKTSTLSI
jgi:hypothetical protein